MSDNIPFEIQAEIIKRVVPVKSLIRFRSVSKQWKSLMDSSQFIIHHTLNHAQPHHLLINYKEDFKDVYVSIADDDSFRIYKFFPWVPITVSRNRKFKTVLWNPSIRKSVGIVLPEFDVVGFGVCPRTCDSKVIKITCVHGLYEIDLKAKVFALSSGGWRNISMNLRWPLKSVDFSSNQVVIDGAICWIAHGSFTKPQYRIISFGLTSEECGEVDLPDSLADSRNLSISELKGSLAVLNYSDSTLVCEIVSMFRIASIHIGNSNDCHRLICTSVRF
ncbi:putative F-box domain-containing protein [Helianthus anomalus]